MGSSNAYRFARWTAAPWDLRGPRARQLDLGETFVSTGRSRCSISPSSGVMVRQGTSHHAGCSALEIRLDLIIPKILFSARRALHLSTTWGRFLNRLKITQYKRSSYVPIVTAPLPLASRRSRKKRCCRCPRVSLSINWK